MYTLIVAYLPISCKSRACFRHLAPDEADDGFASRHGSVPPRIQRVAAAEALDRHPTTLQEAVLVNGLVSVLGTGQSALFGMQHCLCNSRAAWSAGVCLGIAQVYFTMCSSAGAGGYLPKSINSCRSKRRSLSLKPKIRTVTSPISVSGLMITPSS